MFQTGPFGSQLHARDYTATGTPLVMPVNLGDNEIGDAGIARVGKRDVGRLRRHVLRKGDIVFSRRGDVGRRAMVRAEQAGWLCGTGCLVARFGKRADEVNPEYVAEYLGSAAATSWLADNAVGGTMPNLNTRILASLPIVLPSRVEQDAIVNALQQVRRQVNDLERVIAKRQAIKQGIAQQLLTGVIRLPGFSRPWCPRRLSELLAYEQPGRYLVGTTTQLDSGLYPVLTAGKKFILGYTNETQGVYRNHPAIIFDDFTTGSQYVDFDFKVKSSAIKILTSRNDTTLLFMYERMQLLDFQLGDHKRYWISEYGHQTISVPEWREQQAIVNVLADADHELAILRRRVVKWRDIKQGMMQELLTGRTRLPVENTAA